MGMRWAMIAPMPPPMTTPAATKLRVNTLLILVINKVVTMAITIPNIPKRLP